MRQDVGLNRKDMRLISSLYCDQVATIKGLSGSEELVSASNTRRLS